MRIGIMAAMNEEINALVDLLRASSTQTQTVAGREFHSGAIAGIEVVITFSRWGKVAAATTATLMISRFGVDRLWFTGVAGALDPALRIGDIVVADGLVQHDMDARPLFPRFEIPLSGRTLIHATPSERDILLAAAQVFAKDGLRSALSDAQRQEFALSQVEAVTADIATGDRFIAGAAEAAALRAALPTCACVEMEGAAVAQVCAELNIPFAVLRVISDNAQEHAHVDFARFVRQVASLYSREIVSAALGLLK